MRTKRAGKATLKVQRWVIALLVLAAAACSSESSTATDVDATTADSPVSADSSTTSEAADTPEEIAVAIQRPPASFDPLQSNYGGNIQMYMLPVYETLLRQAPDGTFVSGLAQEWGWVNDSQTAFEFTLGEGLVFSDGETVLDASAAKANLDRLFETVGPATAELAQVLDSVEIVDDLTVRINLDSPNPELERILSELIGMMVNPAAFDDLETLEVEPQGAGPYVLDSEATITDDTYVYRRNPHYYRPDEYPFETVVINVFTDPTTVVPALQSGVVQFGYGSPETVSAVEGTEFEIVRQPTNVFHLVLHDRNGELAPALGDVRVRQALNYAVDRDAILQSVYRGEGETTTQIFSPGTWGYDPALNDFYTYDPTKAVELLEEAGYGEGFSFAAALPQVGRDSTYAEALASYFADIGVTMEIAPLPPGTLTVEALQTEYSAFINGFAGRNTFSDALLHLLTPGIVFNPMGTTNPTFAELWQEGTNATTESERVEAYQELSRAVTEEAWFVPTTVVNAIAYYDPETLSDVEFTPNLTLPLFYEFGRGE